MDINNDHLQLRIGVATVLGMVGAAFMSRLPQLLPSQQAIPWYQSGFFWVGIVIVVIALLILIVPPKRWKHIWQSVLGLRRWLRNLYLWMRYGPKYSFGKPSMKQPLPDHQDTYKATITLHIENKDNNPLTVHFSLARFNIEQRVRRRMIHIELKPPIGFPHNEVIESQKERDFNIPFIGFCDETDCLDLGKNYQRGIQGIQVELSGVGRKELHKGLYCKPTQEYHIGVF